MLTIDRNDEQTLIVTSMSHIDPSCPEMRDQGRKLKYPGIGCVWYVCVLGGGVTRPADLSGSFWVSVRTPKQVIFWRGKTVMWGTILCQNGTPRRPNCTGCIKWVLCNFLMGGSTIPTNLDDCWADCVLKTEICVCRQMCTHRARKTYQRPKPTTSPPRHICFGCPYWPE